MMHLYGDGVHDDTIAIQERIDNAGCELILPPPQAYYLISAPLSLENNILRTQCNIVVAKQHIICRKATSFIEDNIILCPLERNDDDRSGGQTMYLLRSQ